MVRPTSSGRGDRESLNAAVVVDQRDRSGVAADLHDRVTVAVAAARQHDPGFAEQTANRCQIDRRQHADVAEGPVEIAVAPLDTCEEPFKTVSGRWTKHADLSAGG